MEFPNSGAINVEINDTGIFTLNDKPIQSGGRLEGKSLFINNGDLVALPAFINGNTTINGKTTTNTFEAGTSIFSGDIDSIADINTTGEITMSGVRPMVMIYPGIKMKTFTL